jgi:hypothetical protein
VSQVDSTHYRSAWNASTVAAASAGSGGPSQAQIEAAIRKAMGAPAAGTASGPIQQVLNTNTLVTLVGDAAVWLTAAGSAAGGHFSLTRTVVTVGGLPAPITWVSSDGRLATVETPSYSDLCAGVPKGSDCGFQPLSIASTPVTPSTLDPILTLATSSAPTSTLVASLQDRAAAAVSCPPFCPGGAFSGDLPSLAGNASLYPSASYVPAAPAALSPALKAISGQGGFYYVQACQGYPLPGASQCLDPASGVRCAFGGGDDCVPCPEGALCPGGYRAWPLPGYWSSSASSATVTRCRQPASLRCTGWNASLGSSACGAGYLQGSDACGACDSGYYAATDGTCSACPTETGTRHV